MNFYNSFNRYSRVLAKPVSTDTQQIYKVSPEQFKFYEDNGYLVIKQLIDFPSLYTYTQHFVRICNGVVPKDAMMRVVKEPALVKKNLKPEQYINKISEILYDDIFFSYAEHPMLLSVLSQFIGDDITAVNSMVINKPPGATFHPPHQDLFYFPFRPAEKIIGAWTAINDVTKENGSLYAVPGSHKANKLYVHGNIEGALKLYHGIVESATVAPEEKRVYLEMSPGDTVFLHPLLVHGSGNNVSNTYRKSITVHFANSSCQYIDIKGTVQEVIAADVEAMFKAEGYAVSYNELWRIKSKQVKGTRSNL